MSSSTPAEVLALELCPVADLRPYHRNPRRGDTTVLRWQLRTGGTPLRNGTPRLLEG